MYKETKQQEEVNVTYTDSEYKIDHNRDSEREKYSTINKINLMNEFEAHSSRNEMNSENLFRYFSQPKLSIQKEQISSGTDPKLQSQQLYVLTKNQQNKQRKPRFYIKSLNRVKVRRA